MIKFWLKSKDNSIYYYSFRDIALDGIISIDEKSNIKLVSAEGEFANDEKSIEKILHVAKDIIKENYPKEFLYATH